VLQQPNITSTTLLPLIAILDELEKLGAHLEYLLLELLVGLDIDFLGEADNGLEVDIFRLWCLLLFNPLSAFALS
jgi:hypothetical protein